MQRMVVRRDHFLTAHLDAAAATDIAAPVRVVIKRRVRRYDWHFLQDGFAVPIQAYQAAAFGDRRGPDYGAEINVQASLLEPSSPWHRPCHAAWRSKRRLARRLCGRPGCRLCGRCYRLLHRLGARSRGGVTGRRWRDRVHRSWWAMGWRPVTRRAPVRWAVIVMPPVPRTVIPITHVDRTINRGAAA